MSTAHRPPSRLLRLIPAVALTAVIVITATSEWTLARDVLILPPAVAWAVPVAIDSYVVASLRTGRDVPAALAVMAGALCAATGAHLASGRLAPGERLPVEVTAPTAAIIMAVLVVVAWRVHVLIEHMAPAYSQPIEGPAALPPSPELLPVVSDDASAALRAEIPTPEPDATTRQNATDDEILTDISPEPPSIRSLMRTYGIGQARATRLHRSATHAATSKPRQEKLFERQNWEQSNNERTDPSEKPESAVGTEISKRTNPEHESHPGITDRVGGLRAAASGEQKASGPAHSAVVTAQGES